MNKLQFRVLYKLFLFRVVDLELLSTSAKGDVSKLLGQFAALLICASLLLAAAGMFFPGSTMPPAQKLAATWATEQFFVSTTMLIVGLFGVLSWDSMFPDRRDVLILLPLSVRIRTLFLAKIAAVAAALGLAVAALHCFAGLVWPVVLAPTHSGVLGLIRSFGSYWTAMLTAGAFVFCSVLCLQGVAALLPRQQFLRVSALLQLVAFWLLLSVYFLQPMMMAPEALSAPRFQNWLAYLPSYWFFGLFQTLNGTGSPAFTALASRAVLGLLVAVLGTCVAFLFSYLRTLRKTVEEPDIIPETKGGHKLPSFGDRPVTAIVQFCIRTLFRSRQHRLILSFFLGAAFTIVILYVKTPLAHSSLLDASGGSPWRVVNVPLLVSSIVMMLFSVIGMRVVFAMPTELRANWVFRATNLYRVSDYLKATRRSLLALAVLPVWTIWAGVFLWLWPLRPALEHLAVLALLGTVLVDACLYGFHKIPFTCSYLPGKANIYYVFFPSAMLSIWILDRAALLERNALEHPTQYAIALLVLGVAAVLLRWCTVALSRSEGSEVRFEEVEPPVVLELGLQGGGASRVQPPPGTGTGSF